MGSDVGYDPDLFEPLLQTLLAQSQSLTFEYRWCFKGFRFFLLPVLTCSDQIVSPNCCSLSWILFGVTV